MFSLKKKKTRGVRSGYPDQAHEILSDGDEPIEWLEQHHRKTTIVRSTGQQRTRNTPTNTNLSSSYNTPSSFSQALYTGSGLDYPMSGDESDNNHNQMEHLRSQFYTPDPQKRTKEYHLEQASQAIDLLKTAQRLDGWKKVDKHKTGCVVYQAVSPTTLPSHGDSKYPAFKGEHIIRGFKAQDVFSIVSVRKLWDDWYDEVSCVENYDDDTTLVYMLMKGTISSKPRDVAMIEKKVVEKDGTIYFAACSVDSDKIPRIPGKVRAEVFLAGWIIQPLPSNPPISKITYVIHTDLLGRLPKFIAKRPLAKRAMVITTIETYLKKNGSPSMATSGPKQHRRSRSLSDPLKPDHFLLPGDSEDEDSSVDFLGPYEPMKMHGLHYIDDSAAESADDEPFIGWEPKQSSAKTPSPILLTGTTLYSEELTDMENSTITGKVESSKKKQDDASMTPNSSRSQQPTTKLSIPERSQERTQDKSSEKRASTNAKAFSPESETRKSQPSSKRFSIPPKSEARTKNYNTSSGHQLAVPGPPALPVTPNTPPLTPAPSINDKDVSDTDVAVSEVKVVPRTPKNTSESDEISGSDSMVMETSGSDSMVIETSGSDSMVMKPPSAIMEARTRRHSILVGGSTPFVPRHSQAVPIRGNPNVSLQSLTRPSGPNGIMTTSVNRHSTAPSLDSNRSCITYTPVMVLPHRHSETARKALAMFKVLAASPEDRWRTVSSENGFKCYSRVISGAGLPMLRGEGTITGGWTVEQINAVIESAGCRQIWDERFDNMSIAETFNHNEYLFHVTLRGVGSLTGRDLAGVTIIDRDPQSSALFNVSTSVLDTTIPEDPGRIRAMLELSGWSLRPTFDGQGNTVSVNVTYVIQIDIRGNLPPSVVKSMTTSMTSTVSRLNQFVNKSGYPPFASHISGTRLLDTFNPTSGFYELCYKATPGWTEVRIGRKVYKEGYDFFIKPDDPSVKVEMAPDFGGVRVWTTLDHDGQSIIAQVSKKGQHSITPEPAEKQAAETKAKEEVTVKNRRRSASSSSPSTLDLSMRPDSQVSIASRASRGRSSRTIVTLPAGTPPPPLPRRSSSLTRYSIPISPYLSGADAPPMPANTSAAIASATEATTPRPISTADSLSSPTLGFFHVPSTPLTPIPATPFPLDFKSTAPLDSITVVLSDTTKDFTSAGILTTAAATTSVTTETVSLSIYDKSMLTPTHEKDEMESFLLNSSPASTPMPSPMAVAFGARKSSAMPPSPPMSPPRRLRNGRRRDVRVTFSLDTIEHATSEDETLQMQQSINPLTTLLRRNSSTSSTSSIRSDNAPTMAREHTVRIVSAQHHHEAMVAEAMQSISTSDCESDEAEFVEARDELTDDETELVLVLTSASAWPSSSSELGLKVIERGLGMLRAGTPAEVKVAIVFLLLVYYAGRLASLIA